MLLMMYHTLQQQQLQLTEEQHVYHVLLQLAPLAASVTWQLIMSCNDPLAAAAAAAAAAACRQASLLMSWCWRRPGLGTLLCGRGVSRMSSCGWILQRSSMWWLGWGSIRGAAGAFDAGNFKPGNDLVGKSACAC